MSVLYCQLSGYFAYDIIYLLSHNVRDKSMYITHHVVTVSVILAFILRSTSTLSRGSLGLWFHVVFSICGEITNPLLNMRRICGMSHGKKSRLYRILSFVSVVLYMICRVIGFPIIFIVFAPTAIELEPIWVWSLLYIVGVGLYLVSLHWMKLLIAGIAN
jgi:hypothetical protein